MVFLRIIDDHEKQKIRVNTAKDLTLCAIDIFSEKNMKKKTKFLFGSGDFVYVYEWYLEITKN